MTRGSNRVSSALPLVGSRQGRILVTGKFRRNGVTMCVIACDCGSTSECRADTWRRGKVHSCGCLKAMATRARMTSHGLADTPEYMVWKSMMRRCGHEPSYVARGTSVCARWRESVHSFIADMGPRPSPDHSIDRIDNEGHYEPGNCRWATRAEQARNTSQTRLITFAGETMCATDWGHRIGVPGVVIRGRLRLGWPLERVFSQPVIPRRGRKRAA